MSDEGDGSVKAVVVYESLWGNTAAVAGAIAEGLGPGTPVLSTAEATVERLDGVGLIVAGGPVFLYDLSSDESREQIRNRREPGAPEPDLSAPSLRTWLAQLPSGGGLCAAFDTRVRGPFGDASPTIAAELVGKGYRLAAEPEGFTVEGRYGPLSGGELERARAWGHGLLKSLAARA